MDFRTSFDSFLVMLDLHFRGRKSKNVKKDGVNGIFWNPILGHGFLMEKESLPQKIYPFPFSSHPLWLKRQTYILGAAKNFGSNFDRMKKCENEGQNEKQKKSC